MILSYPEIPLSGIELIPVGPVEPSIIQDLIPGLRQRFEVEVEVDDAIPLDRDWLDLDRRQYRAGPILDLIAARRREGVSAEGRNGVRSLGMIDADIFAPSLNYIFGQALVGGCCALIGLARLRPEFHRQEPDPQLFVRRVLIEAVHELGHTIGLEHCPDQRCVMHFSRTIEDSDYKGPDFCASCRLGLG